MVGQFIGWIISIVAFVGIGYFIVNRNSGQQKSLLGWNDLNQAFAAKQMPDLYDLTSGTIGMAWYRNTLRIAFADNGVYLMPGIGLNRRPQLIPYQEFVIDTDSPYLSQGISRYVHFLVNDVDIALDKEPASRILAHNNQQLPPDHR